MIGRAARYKSHAKGSVVNVWKIVLQKPGMGVLSGWTGRRWTDRLPSADDWVLKLREKKNKLNTEFEARLKT